MSAETIDSKYTIVSLIIQVIFGNNRCKRIAYEAFADGRIDEERLRETFATSLILGLSIGAIVCMSAFILVETRAHEMR